jgi:hypothetical protein
MASFGFMVHSVSPAKAESNNQKLNVTSNHKLVPTNADGSINVKLSDEQLNKIIPKNEDGSINIKMAPNAVMDVNLKQLQGYGIGSIDAGNGNRGLLVGSCSNSYDCD